MKRWLPVAGAAIVAFVGGWIAGRGSLISAHERCHQAVWLLSKDAPRNRLAEAAKLLTGD